MKRIITGLSIALMTFMASSCSTAPSRDNGAVDYEMSYTVGDATMEMVKLPSGYFTMGLSADNRKKVEGGVIHEVALDGFVISSEPVSQALWTAVMGNNPSSKKRPSSPVDMVSWQDVQKFISKLSKATGKTFMLPTEAQWEYASLNEHGNSYNKVAEWCWDNYGSLDEDIAVTVNPEGPAEKGNKVLRTRFERQGSNPSIRKAGVGFRLVQVDGDMLSEEMLKAINGYGFDRETLDYGDGKPETIMVGDIAIKMIKVKGGDFIMGCTTLDYPYADYQVEDNEKNAHFVELSDYEIGETEVTVALWNEVMGSVPYLNDVKDGKKPVGNVSWYDCQRFVEQLNAMTGRKFRLPTEAEWEFAARGGLLGHHYGFSGSSDMKSVMWFLDNADSKLQDVKTRKPNEIGAYDMSGNVWEWCYDRAADYTETNQADPIGPEEGNQRILRGGSAASRWDACRICNRSFMPAKNVKGTFGLRLAI